MCTILIIQGQCVHDICRVGPGSRLQEGARQGGGKGWSLYPNFTLYLKAKIPDEFYLKAKIPDE